MKVNIYIAGDKRTPGEIERWTGVIIQAEGRGRKGEVKDVYNMHATRYVAMAETIVLALNKFSRPADITVYIDCAYVAGKLKRFPQKDGTAKSTLDRWQEGGWITRRGTKVEHKDNWQRLYNKLRVFEQAGGSFDYEKLEDEEMIGRIENLIETAKKSDQ